MLHINARKSLQYTASAALASVATAIIALAVASWAATPRLPPLPNTVTGADLIAASTPTLSA